MNVLQNGWGKQRAIRYSGLGGGEGQAANLVANLGGADVDMQAGKQVEGGLMAGGIAEDVAAQLELVRRKTYLSG